MGISVNSYARNGKYGAGILIPETALLSTKLRTVNVITVAIPLALNFIPFSEAIIAI